MNLYLISQRVNDGYDTYDTALVAANTADEAKRINPGGLEWSEVKDSWLFCYADGKKEPEEDGTWAKPESVEAECIGVASPGKDAGLIFSSFNAG